MKEVSLLIFVALAGHCQSPPDAGTAIKYLTEIQVNEPVIVYRSAPVYSADARRPNYQSNVEVSLFIGAEGKPEDVRVLKAAGLGLDEKTVEALTQWRFSPGTKDVLPVRVAAVVEAAFRTRNMRITHLDYRIAPDVSAPVPALRTAPLVGENCGSSTIALHIGPDGLPSDVRVMRTMSAAADDLIESVRAWRFKPARRNGLPVGADARIDFDCAPWTQK